MKPHSIFTLNWVFSAVVLLIMLISNSMTTAVLCTAIALLPFIAWWISIDWLNNFIKERKEDSTVVSYIASGWVALALAIHALAHGQLFAMLLGVAVAFIIGYFLQKKAGAGLDHKEVTTPFLIEVASATSGIGVLVGLFNRHESEIKKGWSEFRTYLNSRIN